ncbi:hypothetical protein BGZ63DRAFT_393344 [Mariannaea sp. PMI_226]|nr:hypothetical protein BGZ63DRAFT_393344 [Mariannaea sp. PMI_226]
MRPGFSVPVLLFSTNSTYVCTDNVPDLSQFYFECSRHDLPSGPPRCDLNCLRQQDSVPLPPGGPEAGTVIQC